MKYIFILLCFSLTTCIGAQGLTFHNLTTKATRTINPGKMVKITTAFFVPGDPRANGHQHATGQLLQTTSDSVYLMCKMLEQVGEDSGREYKGSYVFKPNSHIPITVAKRDVVQIAKVSKAKKALFAFAMIGLTVGASSLIGSALIYDKTGSARLLRIGGIGLGSTLVFGIMSSQKRYKINTLVCESPWVID